MGCCCWYWCPPARLNHADATGAWSFDLTDLLKVEEPQAIRSLLFFLLFYGLALRVPLFPLHAGCRSPPSTDGRGGAGVPARPQDRHLRPAAFRVPPAARRCPVLAQVRGRLRSRRDLLRAILALLQTNLRACSPMPS